MPCIFTCEIFDILVSSRTIDNQSVDVFIEEIEDGLPDSQTQSYPPTNLSDAWNMEIAHTITGEIRFSQVVAGRKCRVCTSGWPSGIYVIHVYKNGRTATAKIHVK